MSTGFKPIADAADANAQCIRGDSEGGNQGWAALNLGVLSPTIITEDKLLILSIEKSHTSVQACTVLRFLSEVPFAPDEIRNLSDASASTTGRFAGMKTGLDLGDKYGQ